MSRPKTSASASEPTTEGKDQSFAAGTGSVEQQVRWCLPLRHLLPVLAHVCSLKPAPADKPTSENDSAGSDDAGGVHKLASLGSLWTLSVGYTDSGMASGPNHSRLTSITDPDEWTLNYGYGVGGTSDPMPLPDLHVAPPELVSQLLFKARDPSYCTQSTRDPFYCNGIKEENVSDFLIPIRFDSVEVFKTRRAF